MITISWTLVHIFVYLVTGHWMSLVNLMSHVPCFPVSGARHDAILLGHLLEMLYQFVRGGPSIQVLRHGVVLKAALSAVSDCPCALGGEAETEACPDAFATSFNSLRMANEHSILTGILIFGGRSPCTSIYKADKLLPLYDPIELMMSNLSSSSRSAIVSPSFRFVPSSSYCKWYVPSSV